MTGLAITHTIKNEARFIPDALRYHRALGCRRFYIFLDGTTDAMRTWLADQPDVTLSDSVDPDALAHPPAWKDWAKQNYTDWMDVRKKLNIYAAAQRARADGHGWLATLDPDELILPPEGRGRDRWNAQAWLDTVPTNVDQVLMPNLDALPTPGDGPEPFAKRHFLARLGAIEWTWRQLHRVATRTLRHPKHVARFDQAWFDLMLGRRNPRRLHDPATGNRVPHGYFLSYSNHKSIVRLDRAARFEPNMHEWVRQPAGGPRPRALRSGNVLHFDIIDAGHLAAKFGQRKGQQEHERMLFYPRWAMGRIATSSSDAELRGFFEESMSVADPARLDYLVRRKTVLRIDRVAEMIYGAPTP